MGLVSGSATNLPPVSEVTVGIWLGEYAQPQYIVLNPAQLSPRESRIPKSESKITLGGWLTIIKKASETQLFSKNISWLVWSVA